jgi:flagellar motor switch protein FliN/FliY
MAENPQTPDSNLIDQAELDRLEQEMRQQHASPGEPAAEAPAAEPDASNRPSLTAQDDAPAAAVETPETSAEARAGAAADTPVEGPAVIGGAAASAAQGATPLEMAEFAESSDDCALANIDLLDDVELDVKIELGRTQMYIEDVLRLGEGSVVELDKLAGDPVDVYVNDRLVARGEVLVVNDNFCVRINDIISTGPELEDSGK